MSNYHYLLIGLGFLLSLMLCWRFLQPGSFFHVLDHPNHRSLHESPIPRSGGMAVIGSLLMTITFAWLAGWWLDTVIVAWILPGIMILALAGFMDDRHELSVGWRLLSQCIAASLLLVAGWSIAQFESPWLILNLWWPLSLVFSLLLILWLINLFNFMDGMDGSAGGMAVIGFSSYAFLGFQSGAVDFTFLSLLIAAASAGFLAWNFPPARIFMGDAGSSVLGFLVAALGLWGVSDDLFSLWVVLILFSPFIVDASFTLVRRLIRGERVWEAHREHLYQRLVQIGWGHKVTVSRQYLLMLASAISAIMMSEMSLAAQAWVLLLWLVVYMMLIASVFYLERNAR